MKRSSKALRAHLDFEKLKYCFECGICTASCPVTELLPDHYNPRILLHNLQLGSDKILKSTEIWLCAWCYSCYERCPQRHKLPEIFQTARKLAIEYNLEGFNKTLELIRENIPLPASCCYVCFHPERAIKDKKIVTDAIQHVILDHEIRKKEEPSTATQKEKVAIVGSGPAGLSAAQDLANWGYSVTIFEALPKAGGLLRRCIPKYRLPIKVLDFEIECIKTLGVEIKNNTTIGKDLTIDEILQQGYKAIFIATGAHEEQRIRIKGEELKGVFHALNFLEKIKIQERILSADKVSVIGGGNVAIDSARMAIRVGAKKVTILYRRSKEEMPANPWEIKKAEEEGVKVEYLVSPIKILGEKGKVTAIECIRNELGELDETGRRRPIPIQDSKFIIETDIVVIAIGQRSNLFFLPKEIEITKEGTITTDPFTLETSLSGIFAGGDTVLGPSTVMKAIITGKKAAISIDNHLRRLSLEPIKIVEKALGGT